MDYITRIIYQNSTDDSECIRIKFEIIPKVIYEISQYRNLFALDFAEWLLDNYTRNESELYHLNNSEDSILYTIEELIQTYAPIIP